MFGTRKLGKTSEQRRAMLRQLTTDGQISGSIDLSCAGSPEITPPSLQHVLRSLGCLPVLF